MHLLVAMQISRGGLFFAVGGGGGWIGWLATPLLEKQKTERKLKHIVNIITEIKGNPLDRYLIVISTL